MDIQNVHTLFFSPTATTSTIATTLGKGIIEGTPLSVQNHDYTLSAAPASLFPFTETDLVIVGVPVYAGRVAPMALERLAALQGRETPAVALVMYGNRAYEDALLELSDFLTQRNFSVITGCAFIGEHSYSCATYPIAQGRPDSKDLTLAEETGRRISKLLKNERIEEEKNAFFSTLPGNRPYRQGIQTSEISPSIKRGLCVLCGSCADACPTGALTVTNEVQIETGKCMLCCACIRACQEEAISLNAPSILEKMAWLSSTCKERKEPEIFLSPLNRKES